MGKKVIAYFSKAFSAVDRNYCVIIRELLVTVISLDHFHEYLYRFLSMSESCCTDVVGEIQASWKENSTISDMVLKCLRVTGPNGQ